MRRVIIMAAAAGLSCGAAAAQQRLLTLDDIYGPGSGQLNGAATARLTFLENPWLDDSHYLWPDGDPASPAWRVVNALSGAAEPLFDRAKFTAALRGTGA